jgi:hypothetical protein
MKIVRGFAVGLAVLAMVLLVPSGAYANAANNPTVGDFLTAYAKALNIELPANATSETIVATLRASGVKLDATVDSAKSLTQGDVVRIGKANGLRLSSSNPEDAFTSVEMGQFFASYGAVLAGTNGDTRVAASDNPPGDPASHANTDKGKKKGRPFQSPTEPE